MKAHQARSATRLNKQIMQGQCDRENYVRDMLADLLHYCERYYFDFNDELRIATDNYLEEREEDNETI